MVEEFNKWKFGLVPCCRYDKHRRVIAKPHIESMGRLLAQAKLFKSESMKKPTPMYVCVPYKASLLDGLYTEWTVENETIHVNNLIPFKASSGDVRAGATYPHPTSGTEDEILPKVVAERTPLSSSQYQQSIG